MSEPSTQQPAKPGTACLGCRRRKLKCTREQEGCSNCLKADLPCVYPAPDTGVKRKRGPYKKDKPPRERHLEDLVKYLEPKAAQNETAESASLGRHDRNRDEAYSPSNASEASQDASRGVRKDGDRRTSNSEDLVKDALIALTKSSAENRESAYENGFIAAPPDTHNSVPIGDPGIHPPVRQIFEYWHLFVRRVDPLLKIIHCRTFEKTLFKTIDNSRETGPVTTSLLFAIYYSAVGSCTNRECRKRFGESRESLLQRYGRIIESTLADNYGMPVLESLQALVIYIICIRRDDSVGNIRALFSLAVRMAQLIGLQEDPGDTFSPFETEMRRRLWWHICGLESRGAEEGGARQTSIIEGGQVRLPSNLNDIDLDADSNTPVKPRTGVTDVTFVLARWESVRLVYNLFQLKKSYKTNGQSVDSPDLKAEQHRVLQEQKLRNETYYLRHLDGSRPMDWMCIHWFELMSIKSRLIVDFPLGQVPTKEMTQQERHDLLRSSVGILRISHGVGTNKFIDDWLWYFRGWVQWHSIAIIIAELGGNQNQNFVNTAWAVLDPILADWDKVYNAKKDEPAWIHVNALIQKARQMRQQVPASERQAIERLQDQQHAPSITAQAPNLQSHTIASSNDPRAPGTSMVGLVPDAAWQSGWDIPDGFELSSHTAGPHYQQTLHPTPSHPQQRTYPIHSISNTEIPFDTSCAPPMHGFDSVDFGYIEGLDNIDFSAFDFVFKDTAWDFSSPSTDNPSIEHFNPQ